MILFILSLIQYRMDIHMHPCNHIWGNVILYIHHILNIYIYFGGFLLNPLYHFIVVVLTMMHWILNDNKCFLTEIVNDICYPEYSEYSEYSEYKQFNDFSKMLGLQDNYPHISYYYLLMIMIYDYYLIVNN